MSAWPSRCALHHSTSLLPLLNVSQPLPPATCRFSANAASTQQLINSSCKSCCVLSRRRRHDRVQICRAAVAQQGGLSYKDAGVDIDAGNELVRRIKQLNPAIGGFSGAYEYGEAGFVDHAGPAGSNCRLRRSRLQQPAAPECSTELHSIVAFWA